MPDATYTYDLATSIGKVRLLLNDIPTGDEDAAIAVFSDEEIQVFLDLEGDAIKLAAAQAIDTNADNELLASKVLKTQDVETDGAKLADAMRKRATSLRDQHHDADDEGYFEIIGSGGAFELC